MTQSPGSPHATVGDTNATTGDTTEAPSFALRFAQLATEQPDQPAISMQDKSVSFAALDRQAERVAHLMLDLDVKAGDFVTIAEPNSAEFLIAGVACWKIGAIPQPVSSRLPGLELQQIVELADSALVIGADLDGRTCLATGYIAPLPDGPPLSERLGAEAEEVMSPAWKAPTSGGSTGRPKLIVSGDPSQYRPNLAGLGDVIGAAAGATMVVPGPLYHNGPFIWAYLTLLAGGHVQLLPRFEAEATLAAVQDSEASAIYLVPTMMQRIWKLPDDVKFSYDLSSLKTAFHLAEPCPPWLKDEWLDWLGPDVLFELYGGTEGQMFTVISGTEWLEHRGSVGRPVSGEAKICDTDGNDLAPGEEGEVWMRWIDRDTPTYTYIGDASESRDGWECLGDMGWMDAEGYLYLGDRRKDMILVGGANIYPAEVEAAIGSHAEVLSSAVIGLPDDDKGNRIHAIVQRAPGATLDEKQLLTYLAERLVTYKLPRSIEWSETSLRDDAGKVRRAALRDERLAV